MKGLRPAPVELLPHALKQPWVVISSALADTTLSSEVRADGLAQDRSTPASSGHLHQCARPAHAIARVAGATCKMASFDAWMSIRQLLRCCCCFKRHRINCNSVDHAHATSFMPTQCLRQACKTRSCWDQAVLRTKVLTRTHNTSDLSNLTHTQAASWPHLNRCQSEAVLKTLAASFKSVARVWHIFGG